jgi:hypothetical protein
MCGLSSLRLFFSGAGKPTTFYGFVVGDVCGQGPRLEIASLFVVLKFLCSEIL